MRNRSSMTDTQSKRRSAIPVAHTVRRTDETSEAKKPSSEKLYTRTIARSAGIIITTSGHNAEIHIRKKVRAGFHLHEGEAISSISFLFRKSENIPERRAESSTSTNATR